MSREFVILTIIGSKNYAFLNDYLLQLSRVQRHWTRLSLLCRLTFSQNLWK
uniref:Uncharacterized protein n=1 Tax=Amphimedon queenslandica TaxID=400682 RepID=A0A1X7V6T4_AMPQE